MEENTEDGVVVVVAECLGQHVSDLKRETDLKSLEFDTLDRVDVMMELEERFQIEIKDDAFDDLTTLGQVIDAVDAIRHPKET